VIPSKQTGAEIQKFHNLKQIKHVQNIITTLIDNNKSVKIPELH
jgi:hypothetical protein